MPLTKPRWASTQLKALGMPGVQADRMAALVSPMAKIPDFLHPSPFDGKKAENRALSIADTGDTQAGRAASSAPAPGPTGSGAISPQAVLHLPYRRVNFHAAAVCTFGSNPRGNSASCLER